jgi:hypothetical protein
MKTFFTLLAMTMLSSFSAFAQCPAASVVTYCACDTTADSEDYHYGRVSMYFISSAGTVSFAGVVVQSATREAEQSDAINDCMNLMSSSPSCKK